MYGIIYIYLFTYIYHKIQPKWSYVKPTKEKQPFIYFKPTCPMDLLVFLVSLKVQPIKAPHLSMASLSTPTWWPVSNDSLQIPWWEKDSDRVLFSRKISKTRKIDDQQKSRSSKKR